MTEIYYSERLILSDTMLYITRFLKKKKSIHRAVMTRSRGNSLVLSIAAHSGKNRLQALPDLLDDSYLIEKLQELSNQVGPVDKEVITESTEEPLTDKYVRYTDYSAKLGKHIEEYENILLQSQKINEGLEEATSMFEKISLNVKEFVDNTKKTHDDCSRLSRLHEQIPCYLAYFDALDKIMRKLNRTTNANAVRKNSFKSMLTSIDESLGFLESHMDMKDARPYRIKSKKCLVKAYGLIAQFLNDLLKRAYVEINEKIASSGSSSASKEALLYNKFALYAEEYQNQIVEFISRLTGERYQTYSEVLLSILNSCYDCYFQTRIKLLHPSIQHKFHDLQSREDQLALINLIQDGKTYFQQLCRDEYQLFIKFFPEEITSKLRVNQWFIRLCEPLYDTIRIRILRETDIPNLCDCLTLFGHYYEFEEDSEEYQRQFGQIKYDKIFEPIVQNLQATLILRVQNYVHNKIVKYTPTLDSFIIANRKSLKREGDTGEKEDSLVLTFVENYQNESLDDTLESYYPPLIRGLALLSRIYEMINSVVFNDLAHHIVHDCILSLKTAYSNFQFSNDNYNNFDVKLAYLRNLLMLRQQLQNFNIQYSVSETYLDFSGVESFFKTVTDGARTLRLRDSSVLTAARSLVPKVVNNLVDARVELVTELRNIITDFTEAVSKNIIQDTLILQPSSTSNLLEKNSQLRNNVQDRLPRIHTQICSFINNDLIVSNLLDAVQEIIIQSYSSFYEEVNDKAQAGLLNREQASELMHEDAFAAFLNKFVSGLLITDKN